jgi:hypothetical protein
MALPLFRGGRTILKRRRWMIQRRRSGFHLSLKRQQIVVGLQKFHSIRYRN